MNTFPWPVITDDPETSDYAEKIIPLHGSLELAATSEGMEVNWTPDAQAPYVKQLLAAGTARWVIEFSCAKTMLLRREYLKDGETLDKLLSFDEYRGDVDMNVFVECVETIEVFKPEGLSPGMLVFEFSMNPGDIIGIAHINLFADPGFHNAPGMRSLFKILPAQESDTLTSYRYSDNGEYFTITLSKDLYGQFEKSWRNNNGAGKKAASALVVLAPMSLIIQDMINKRDEPESLSTSHRRLSTLLESVGISELTANTQPIEAALKLLHKSEILKTCFEKLSKR
jgi:hypothetical protein